MNILESDILNKTRAEEHDADVWGEFYIPPYFHKLNLKRATKSSYIVGKRGCGKTMLLKYLDYHTAFSKNRAEMPSDEVSHIGIYWRVDTQFCNSLNYRGLDEFEWTSIFESYFSLVISIEIIRSLEVIANSLYDGFSRSDFEKNILPSLSDFHPDFPNKLTEVDFFLESCRRKFSSWVSNISIFDKPFLIPGKSFLESLIKDIQQISGLESASFYVYIDEVENLVPYQRRLLNSFLKHSQQPLIVSFTSKEVSSETATTGPESINATHDFKLIELDGFLDNTETKIFFAEVFLANLDLAEGKTNSLLIQILCDQNALKNRNEKRHQDNILGKIRGLFPSRSKMEFAKEAINVPRVKNILKEKIIQALKKYEADDAVDDFFEYTDIPDALLIIPALLNREKHSPKELLIQLNKYRNKEVSKFKDWVPNNLVGALLELYRPYGSICPIYSGFETFFTLSSYNLRHFLIVCYKALEIADIQDEPRSSISIDTQARASHDAAEQLLREIKTFGSLGEQLRMFVLRLGHLFRVLQAVPAMSEPEQNQFTINSGARSLDKNELDFISEALKFAIIIEQLETKTKNKNGTDMIDYQLNPIYSPYFQISYRRKRKIDISVDEFNILAFGTEDAYTKFITKHSKPKIKIITSSQQDIWK